VKPTHTKFLSRYEAELFSSICLATDSQQQVFDQVWLIDHGDKIEKGHTPTLEPKQTALISINSPNDGDPKERALRAGQDGPPKVSGFWQPLMLNFHDIDPTNCGEEFLSKYVLFDEAMAGEVLDYLMVMEKADGVYACWTHCQAGISRSAGVSKFVAEIYKLWYPETYRLYNKHVYSTLRSVYNSRVLTDQPVPGVLHL
jgi:hypothetical protein